MLHISPRIPNQPFADLPTEEEILDFRRFLGHSHDIRYLTDVNVNKLYQPWRSFALVINKCLTGKSSGVDSFRVSQAQMLWRFYHRINIEFAYLIWEDFVYQVVSRHQTTQQYGATVLIELTTDEIRNSKAYKEYYACAMGEAAPKPKASARKRKNMIMATTIEQQTALDESLVPSSQRLRIGRSNFRLPSDIQSKEATLQVVYDVLRNSPLFRAFQVTAVVPYYTTMVSQLNSKKVLIREEVGHPVTKHVNSISLIRGKEENSAEDKAIFGNSIVKPDRSDAVIPLKEVEKENELENGTKNKPVESAEKKLT
nr:hypothetical protein [Tanacetum cinerariifolium]